MDVLQDKDAEVTGSSLNNITHKGISDKFLKKFEILKKRRLEVSKKSSEKRINKLKEDILQKVQSELVHEEDLDILRQHDIELSGASAAKKLKMTHSESKDDGITTDSRDENEEQWKSVRKYVSCNDHLKGVDPGKYAPKTNTEKDIDEAIKDGDFAKAETLSDGLAVRELGKKVADAFDAKKFADGKEEKNRKAKEKRRKKLPWGFEAKHRWETKSNM